MYFIIFYNNIEGFHAIKITISIKIVRLFLYNAIKDKKI